MSHQTQSEDNIRQWTKIDPPFWWKEINAYVVADRHLPDGTRQHLVKGYTGSAIEVNNAKLIRIENVFNKGISNEF